jgi:hypothetical protein
MQEYPEFQGYDCFYRPRVEDPNANGFPQLMFSSGRVLPATKAWRIGARRPCVVKLTNGRLQIVDRETEQVVPEEELFLVVLPDSNHFKEPINPDDEPLEPWLFQTLTEQGIQVAPDMSPGEQISEVFNLTENDLTAFLTVIVESFEGDQKHPLWDVINLSLLKLARRDHDVPAEHGKSTSNDHGPRNRRQPRSRR